LNLIYDDDTMDNEYIDIDDDSNTQFSFINNALIINNADNNSNRLGTLTAASILRNRSRTDNNNSNNNNNNNQRHQSTEDPIDANQTESDGSGSDYSDWADQGRPSTSTSHRQQRSTQRQTARRSVPLPPLPTTTTTAFTSRRHHTRATRDTSSTRPTTTTTTTQRRSQRNAIPRRSSIYQDDDDDDDDDNEAPPSNNDFSTESERPTRSKQTKIKKTKKIIVSDEDEEEGEEYEGEEEEEEDDGDSQTEEQNTKKRNTKNDAFCESEDEDEEEEEEEYSDNQNDDSSYSDQMDDEDKPCTSSSTTTTTKKTKKRGRRSNTAASITVAKQKRRKRPKKTKLSSSLETTPTKTKEANLNQKSSIKIEDLKECPTEYRPPEWLTSTKPKKSPYMPQIGDSVVYFRQGHELYVETVKKHNIYTIVDDSLPWSSSSPITIDVQEFCKVIDLRIEIKPPRIVCLKLKISSTGHEFDVSYHDMAHVVEFVILRQYYDRSISKNWRPKDRFRCLIDDSWYFGTIESKKPFEEKFPDCEFQSLLIKWDSNETDALSPWDLDPISGINTRKTRPATSSTALATSNGDSIPVTAEEMKKLLYEPSEAEWLGIGRDAESDRILKGLSEIMSLSIAEHFNYPVDLVTFPEYATTINYPIDLNTIKERLENLYYRRIESIQWDVKNIEINAVEFNESGSLIVQKAKMLTELLLEFINDPHCTNPMPIYKRLHLKYNVLDETENNNNNNNKRNQQRKEKNNKNERTTRQRSNGRVVNYHDDDDDENEENDDEEDDDHEHYAGQSGHEETKYERRIERSCGSKNNYFIRRTSSRALQDTTNGSIPTTSSRGRHLKQTPLSSSSSLSLKKTTKKYSWQSDALKLMNKIFKTPDSEPFREPVDLTEVTDYLDHIETPMDFGTIRDRLKSNYYGRNVKKFDDDCALVFFNSKHYNTNKRSQVNQFV
jgi:hypothetical protein